MLFGIAFACLAFGATAVPAPQAPAAADQPIPATGENGKPSGIFGFGDLKMEDMLKGSPNANKGGTGPPSMLGGIPKGSETPAVDLFDDGSEGTGKYPAHHIQDGPGTRYTVYAPKKPPPTDVKLPVLVYAACGGAGTSYTNLLTEIASHGYFVIAAGPPAPKFPSMPAFNMSSLPKFPAFNLSSLPKFPAFNLSSLPKMPAFNFTMPLSTDVTQMKNAVDWVIAGKASKYGNIDTAHIATGGLSCGGLQAMSTSYHDDRIKLTLVLHSGVVEDSKAYLLKELNKYPIAYIIGGPKDIAYNNAERDWITLPQNVTAVKINLDSGHIGTMFAPNAGKEGVAVIALLDAFFKGDTKAKAMFFDKDSKLFKAGFNITTKNW